MRSEAFRGSEAVRRGKATAKQLRGPRYQRVLRDVYVPAGTAVDLAVRSQAAYVLADGQAVLSGFSAAEVLGASCAPADAPAELTIIRGRPRLTGITVHRDHLHPDEITTASGLRVTTPLRTAFDLARRLPLREAVVAVDALARVGRFDPHELATLRHRHFGARGNVRLTEVQRLADPRSGSPMETRIRFGLVTHGLPAPVPQHPVGPYFLDLAYPEVRLGIEYDGREHLTPHRARRDLERQAYLTAAGWTILRFSAEAVLDRPQYVANYVRAALIRPNVP
jgi:hypothetical protein